MNCELMLTYDTPAYMFNEYKNQPSRQTGSRNVTGPKTLPTIWGTYMKLVTKYQISDFCHQISMDGWKDRQTEGRTEVNQFTPPPPLWWSGGIIMQLLLNEKGSPSSGIVDLIQLWVACLNPLISLLP